MADAVPSDTTEIASNTNQTVLDTAHNVRIYSIYAEVTDAESLTNLIVTVTIDGNSIIHTEASPSTGTVYYCVVVPAVAAASQALSATGTLLTDKAFLYEGNSVKVQIKCTVDTGTLEKLECRVKYGVKP